MASFFVCGADDVRPIPIYDSKTSPAFHKNANRSITSHIEQCDHCHTKYGSSIAKGLSISQLESEVYLSTHLLSIPDPTLSASASPRIDPQDHGSLSPISPITDRTPKTPSVDLPDQSTGSGIMKYSPTRSGTLTANSPNSSRYKMEEKMDRLQPPPMIEIIHDVASDTDTVCRELEGVDDSKLFGDFAVPDDVENTVQIHDGDIAVEDVDDSDIDIDRHEPARDSDDPMNLSHSASRLEWTAQSGDAIDKQPTKYKPPPRHRFNQITGSQRVPLKRPQIKRKQIHFSEFTFDADLARNGRRKRHGVLGGNGVNGVNGQNPQNSRPRTGRVRRQSINLHERRMHGREREQQRLRADRSRSPSRPYARLSPRTSTATSSSMRRRPNKRNRRQMTSTPSPSPRKSKTQRLVVDTAEEEKAAAAFSGFERLRKKQKRHHGTISRKLIDIQQQQRSEVVVQGLDQSRDTESDHELEDAFNAMAVPMHRSMNSMDSLHSMKAKAPPLSLRNTESSNHYRSKRERKRGPRADHRMLTTATATATTKVVEKVIVHHEHHHHHHHHHHGRARHSKSKQKRKRPQTVKGGYKQTFFGAKDVERHPLRGRKSEIEHHRYYEHHYDHEDQDGRDDPSDLEYDEEGTTPTFIGPTDSMIPGSSGTLKPVLGDPLMDALYGRKSMRTRSPKGVPRLRLYPHSYHVTHSEHSRVPRKMPLDEDLNSRSFAFRD